MDDMTGLSGGEEILPAKTCLVVWDPGYGAEYIWTADQAREHCAQLYQRVIGGALL